MAILNQLPDELLLEIFNSLFIPPPAGFPSEDTKEHHLDGTALPKVSRRFYRLATPGLYTHLDVIFHVDNSYSSAQFLHRTLSENSELRSYCRSLRLTLPDPDAETVNGKTVDEREAGIQAAMDMATDLVGWLTNTKHLYVQGYFTHARTDAAMWSLVHTAGRHMSKLERLSLGKQVWLERVCKILSELEQLRTLEIGIGVMNEPDTPFMATPEAHQVASSPITSLSVDFLLTEPENLRRILLLPAKLERFSFNGLFPASYWAFPLATMISVLEPHQTTLRTVRVASAIASGITTSDFNLEDQVEDLDLSAFTALEGITFVPAPL